MNEWINAKYYTPSYNYFAFGLKQMNIFWYYLLFIHFAQSKTAIDFLEKNSFKSNKFRIELYLPIFQLFQVIEALRHVFI